MRRTKKKIKKKNNHQHENGRICIPAAYDITFILDTKWRTTSSVRFEERVLFVTIRGPKRTVRNICQDDACRVKLILAKKLRIVDCSWNISLFNNVTIAPRFRRRVQVQKPKALKITIKEITACVQNDFRNVHTRVPPSSGGGERGAKSWRTRCCVRGVNARQIIFHTTAF